MDDLRATAERLLRIAEGEDDGDGAPPPFEAFDDQQIAGLFAPIIRAWLANHPADDAEPVTAEWLRVVGFEVSHGGQSMSVDMPHGRILHHWTVPNHWWLSDPRGDKVSIYQMANRGDVRRLCAALGAPLNGVT